MLLLLFFVWTKLFRLIKSRLPDEDHIPQNGNCTITLSPDNDHDHHDLLTTEQRLVQLLFTGQPLERGVVDSLSQF